MSHVEISINSERLLRRIRELGRDGALEGGGVSRLALTDADRAGRDRVVGWMRELGLRVCIDALGNTVGVWDRGSGDGRAPVMMGSHIDTVRTGGLYDGNLGVLAGLEVIQTLQEASVQPERPLAVAFFTNEEGARFAPDMMGSMVYTGALPEEVALSTVGIDGTSVADNLTRIGYAGSEPCGSVRPHAYVELHIEQGPVLEEEGYTIGAVEGVQGISWMEYRITGVSNHAGTTPMRLRHDAGYAACALGTFVRELAKQLGGDQVGTVGLLELRPNLVNVVASEAVLTVDLRNTDEAVLRQAEARVEAFVAELATAEGVEIRARRLARFEPVAFAPEVVGLVERTARAHGLKVRRLPSGAGHDAQMFVPWCPTGMVFVPSRAGISHNVKEHTDPTDIEAGANVLLHTVLALAG